MVPGRYPCLWGRRGPHRHRRRRPSSSRRSPSPSCRPGWRPAGTPRVKSRSSTSPASRPWTATGASLQSVLETNPEALALARGARRRARGREAAGPAARHPGAAQGQHRHRRPDGDDGRVAGARGLERAARLASSPSGSARPGAVLLAKTNLSEWANIRSTRSSSGWSGRGGQCRNPYVLDRNPCGSSSGSGGGRVRQLRRRGRRAPRPTARSSAPRRPTAWSASSRPWGW